MGCNDEDDQSDPHKTEADQSVSIERFGVQDRPNEELQRGADVLQDSDQ